MRTLLTILVLMLALAGCADPDAAGDPTEPPADGPIPVEPDGGIGDTSAASGTPVPIEGEGDIGDGNGPTVLEEAPDFGVSSETDSDSLSPYTSCWTGSDGQGLCADGLNESTLTLTAADQLVITYETGELTVQATATATEDPANGTELPAVQENPGIWLVDVSGLAEGEHAIHLSWEGEQGDAFAVFTAAIAR